MAKTIDKEVPEITPGATIKNFKNSHEVENFYRFISDNRIREEARKLVEVVLKKITPPKRRGRRKNLQ